MSKKCQTVSVCGCALADRLYTKIRFDSDEIKPFLSVLDGDGGISPGKLVFAEDLEKFSGVPYADILQKISGGSSPDAVNLGGPAIVGAVNAAQILHRGEARFSFYGIRGDDPSGRFIESILQKTPLNCTHYEVYPGDPPPCTDVLSAPSAHNGKGERSFLNRIGSSVRMTVQHLENGFFDADIHWYAATALVPDLHDHLTTLLRKSKQAGRINVVSTVFDFRNEKKDPVDPWPLGESVDSYRFIDLLIVDFEEALRLSGKHTIEDAACFFRTHGVSSFFITYGAKNFYVWSDGRLFASSGSLSPVSCPVSALADADLAEHPELRGDTTGCGDNFAGGIVSSLARQLYEGCPAGSLSLVDAAAWGAASGGAALFQIGGTCVEKVPGEKEAKLRRYAEAYLADPAVRELHLP